MAPQNSSLECCNVVPMVVSSTGRYPTPIRPGTDGNAANTIANTTTPDHSNTVENLAVDSGPQILSISGSNGIIDAGSENTVNSFGQIGENTSRITLHSESTGGKHDSGFSKVKRRRNSIYGYPEHDPDLRVRRNSSAGRLMEVPFTLSPTSDASYVKRFACIWRTNARKLWEERVGGLKLHKALGIGSEKAVKSVESSTDEVLSDEDLALHGGAGEFCPGNSLEQTYGVRLPTPDMGKRHLTESPQDSSRSTSSSNSVEDPESNYTSRRTTPDPSSSTPDEIKLPASIHGPSHQVIWHSPTEGTYSYPYGNCHHRSGPILLQKSMLINRNSSGLIETIGKLKWEEAFLPALPPPGQPVEYERLEFILLKKFYHLSSRRLNPHNEHEMAFSGLINDRKLAARMNKIALENGWIEDRLFKAANIKETLDKHIWCAVGESNGSDRTGTMVFPKTNKGKAKVNGGC